MTESHVSGKVHQVLLGADDFSTEAISLACVDFSTRSAGCNTASILAAVLQDGKTIVDVGDGRSLGIGEDHGNDSTHAG